MHNNSVRQLAKLTDLQVKEVKDVIITGLTDRAQAKASSNKAGIPMPEATLHQGWGMKLTPVI